MSRRDDDDARLVADAFHEDWNAGRAAAFAQNAAAHARRRRTVSRSLRAVVATVGVGVAAFVTMRQPAATRQPASMVPPAPSRGYEIMSDEELLNNVRDQPLLAVKTANGTREVVLLQE